MSTRFYMIIRTNERFLLALFRILSPMNKILHTFLMLRIALQRFAKNRWRDVVLLVRSVHKKPKFCEEMIRRDRKKKSFEKISCQRHFFTRFFTKSNVLYFYQGILFRYFKTECYTYGLALKGDRLCYKTKHLRSGSFLFLKFGSKKYCSFWLSTLFFQFSFLWQFFIIET